MTSRLIVSNQYKNRVSEIEPVLSFGRVQKVVGTTIIAKGPHTALGDWCRIKLRNGRMRDALVVGFQNHQVILMAFGPVEGIGSATRSFRRRRRSRSASATGCSGAFSMDSVSRSTGWTTRARKSTVRSSPNRRRRSRAPRSASRSIRESRRSTACSRSGGDSESASSPGAASARAR